MIRIDDAASQTVPASAIHTDDVASQIVPLCQIHTDDAASQTIPPCAIRIDDAVSQTVPPSMIRIDGVASQTVLPCAIRTNEAASQTVPASVIHTNDAASQTVPASVIHYNDAASQTVPASVIRIDNTKSQTIPPSVTMKSQQQHQNETEIELVPSAVDTLLLRSQLIRFSAQFILISAVIYARVHMVMAGEVAGGLIPPLLAANRLEIRRWRCERGGICQSKSEGLENKCVKCGKLLSGAGPWSTGRIDPH